jgi:hypothetical protein
MDAGTGAESALVPRHEFIGLLRGAWLLGKVWGAGGGDGET